MHYLIPKSEIMIRFTIFFTLISLNCFSAQSKDTANYIDYYQHRNEAMFYLYEQDFEKANSYFELALSLEVKPFEFDTYCYAASLCELGRKEQAKQLLKLNPYSNRILIDSSYFSCFLYSEKVRLQHNGDSLRKLRSNEINESQIFKHFENYYQYDQSYRVFIRDTINQNHSISEAEKQRQRDSIFTLFFIEFDKMDSILRSEGGFVGLGPQDMDWGQVFTSLFLLHVREGYYEKNEVYLLNQIAMGRLTPFLYAAGFDRFLYYQNGLPEFYESYVKKIDPHLDPKIRFDRLNSIGISPYHERSMALKPKGKIPKSRYYDEYKVRKEKYNCVTSK